MRTYNMDILKDVLDITIDILDNEIERLTMWYDRYDKVMEQLINIFDEEIYSLFYDEKKLVERFIRKICKE